MHTFQPTMARLQVPGTAMLQQVKCCRGRAGHAMQERSLLQIVRSYSIRGIQPTDIPKLVLIEQQCQEFSACWSSADIAAELDNSLSRAAVAADAASDEALGYIVCWLVAGELQVLECAVDPAHQSKGIGTALLQHMLATHSHPQGAVLEVKTHNSRAIRLYKRLGFQEVGRRPKFYACGADALLMARTGDDKP